MDLMFRIGREGAFVQGMGWRGLCLVLVWLWSVLLLPGGQGVPVCSRHCDGVCCGEWHPMVGGWVCMACTGYKWLMSAACGMVGCIPYNIHVTMRSLVH